MPMAQMTKFSLQSKLVEKIKLHIKKSALFVSFLPKAPSTKGLV
jgi:hypothetical protein